MGGMLNAATAGGASGGANAAAIDPAIGLPSLALEYGLGVAQNTAQQTAAMQSGLNSVEKFGVFSDSANAAGASIAASTFQNQGPLSLTALNLDSLDTVTPQGIQGPFSLTPLASALSNVPSWAWIAFAVVGAWILFGGKHR